MKTDKDISALAQELGSRGGRKTAQRGRDYYVQIGKKGLAKRWGNHIEKIKGEVAKGGDVE